MANNFLKSLLINTRAKKKPIHNLEVYEQKEKEYKMESVADEIAHTIVIKMLYLKNETIDFDIIYNGIFDEYIFTSQEIEYIKNRTFKILKENYNLTTISKTPLVLK